jgi:hypothetical protein
MIPRATSFRRARALADLSVSKVTLPTHAPMNAIRLFPLEGSSAHDPAVQDWFSSAPSELRVEARRWFEEFRGCGPDVMEVLHDGHPAACVDGYALGYVNAFSSHVNVGFFLGATVDDPTGLLEGSGRFMRHVKVGPGAPRDAAALQALIHAAYKALTVQLRQHEHRAT